MRPAERLAAILDGLAEEGSVQVADLAARLGVSPTTIRRDLERLEDQRMLTRTHGGAIAHGVLYELPVRYRSARHEDEKRRIAAAASARVQDGSIVGFTGGTTTTEVSRSIVGREGLTVVTNAMNIAGELAIRADLKLIVTGGTARPESYELVGPIAERALSEMNLDVAFVGVDGIEAGAGLTTHHEIEAHTNRTLVQRARRVVVVADGSKVGRVAFARICATTDVHELVTDAGAPHGPLHALEAAGLEVQVV